MSGDLIELNLLNYAYLKCDMVFVGLNRGGVWHSNNPNAKAFG